MHIDYAYLESSDNNINICSFQFFGWYFCSISTFIRSVTTILFNHGESKFFVSLGKVSANYDPLVSPDNYFCSAGLKVDFFIDDVIQTISFSVDPNLLEIKADSLVGLQTYTSTS